MTIVEDVEKSLDIMTNTIKRANARELQGILLALIGGSTSSDTEHPLRSDTGTGGYAAKLGHLRPSH